ncbi:long-chain-fatty-acid-CoA-ligase [Mrakia frigida]|uniref:long-chain-fatty-acid-CoA-ligase n=1 Tax=Mrakia frigida TaxID=29902 RepID=UPI003FCC140E
MAPRKGNELGSWEVDPKSPQPKGETRARRSYCVKELVTQPLPGIDTTYDVVQYAATTYPNRRAFGTRPVLDIVKETKTIAKMVGGQETTQEKEWSFFKLGAYEWITYKEFAEWTGWLATGLWELGLGRREGAEDQFVNIFGATNVNWQAVAQACSSISTPFCTAYDTLGPSGLTYAINQPSVRAIFANGDLLPMVVKIIDDCPSLKIVIYDGEPSEDILAELRAKDGVKVLSLKELEALGKSKGAIKAVPPKRSDVCCVMYTSGSTGTPKGVTLSHGNLTASVAAVSTLLHEVLDHKDLYLAFLPLAHILEIVVENSWIFVGMPIGYGKIKTLTDANVRGCKGDIAELKPTIMCGVPAVWEAIRKGVTTKVAAAPFATRTAFAAAYSSKLFARKWGIPIIPALADAIVFKKVKAQTGGRLRFVLNGGAKLSDASQEFLTNSLVTVLNGYGLTETVGMTAVMHPDFYSTGPAGNLVPSMEVKLVDIPDAGYLSTNNPPTGEIYCRGPSLFQGYFKQPDLDAEALTPDGWFKTGDVGQFNKDGTLSVIDRIKNLVKLAGGEYVALEKLESVYKSNPIVGNMAVMANSEVRQPIAVVVAHDPNFHTFVATKNLNPTNQKDVHELVKDPKIRNAVLAEINGTGRKAGLNQMELLQGVVLVADEWTPESGLVTAAQKLQRKAIEKRYEADVKKAYGV